MKLQKFNGGLATRLAPQYIKTDQARTYLNADSSTGELSPVKDKTDLAIAIDQFFAYFKKDDEYISSNSPTDFLEFQGFMYSSDRTDRPTKRRNGVTNLLGIERPTSAPTLINQDLTASFSSVLVTSGETVSSVDNVGQDIEVAGDLPTAPLEYMLFTSRNGVYSAGHRISVPSYVTPGISVKYRGKFIPSDEDFSPEFALTDLDTTTTRAVKFTNFEGKFDELTAVCRFYNGVLHFIGATYPGGIVGIPGSATIIDSVYELDSPFDLTQIAKFNGTYQYVYTYYNSVDGTESAPSDLSEELKVDSGYIQVDLGGLPADPQVTHKRIYRIGNNIAVFTMVAEVDKADTSYNDSLSDTNIDGRTLTTENYFEAPAGLKYLTEAYAMLFGALGDQLRFTPIGKPNAWPPEYSIAFDDDITGIGQTPNGLLVMTLKSTHIITGTGPFSLSKQPIRGDQGCISHDSVQQVEGGLVWASSDGLCVSSGNNPKNITKYQLGDLKFNPVASCVHNEVYYLLNNDGIIFVWDYRFEPVFKHLNLDVDSVQSADGKLLGHKDGAMYELLSANDVLSFDYVSPKFIEGTMTELKMYNKLFMYTEGQVHIEVSIDGKVVITKDFTETGLKEFKIPQDKQRGYYIQFAISGTGTVSEIEYEVGRRKNG